MEKETWRKWSDDEEEDKALANGFTGKGVTHQATEECIGPKVKKLKKNYEDIAMNETVRKKSERKQLEAFDCLECQAYYGSLNMSEQERQERVKTCSRHRGTTARPSTPEGFWDTGMPTTPEAIKKGLIKISSQSQLSKSLDGKSNTWS